jgi:hypothetical protein
VAVPLQSNEESSHCSISVPPLGVVKVHLFCLFVCFWSFGSTGVWTQDLTLYHLSNAQLVLLFFREGLVFLPGSALDCNPPTFAGITDVCHHAQSLFVFNFNHTNNFIISSHRGFKKNFSEVLWTTSIHLCFLFVYFLRQGLTL